MKVRIFLCLALIQNSAFADFMPFNHDILCISNNDFSTVKIVYDKTEYPDLGWQGGIHWEIYTGFNSQLGNILAINSMDDGANYVMTKEGAAGTITNWIEQDIHDPVIMQSSISGSPFHIKKNGKEVGEILTNYFDSITISKITDKGYGYLDRQIRERQYYLVQLNSTTAMIRYELDECKVLN